MIDSLFAQIIFTPQSMRSLSLISAFSVASAFHKTPLFRPATALSGLFDGILGKSMVSISSQSRLPLFISLFKGRKTRRTFLFSSITNQ